VQILFDESVTWALRPILLGEHEVATAKYLGWDSKSNGELMTLARDKFDVLITADQSIPYQQNITEADVAVVVLVARTNDINDLKPLVPELLNRLNDLKRGEIIRIEAGQNEESP
jgi:predicted ThiF/HesA family dinucleotide-utilizing enzyme